MYKRQATQSPILHTSGELRQKLFKICTAMSVENDVCRSGRYIMLKSYLMQMLILLLREDVYKRQDVDSQRPNVHGAGSDGFPVMSV